MRALWFAGLVLVVVLVLTAAASAGGGAPSGMFPWSPNPGCTTRNWGLGCDHLTGVCTPLIPDLYCDQYCSPGPLVWCLSPGTSGW